MKAMRTLLFAAAVALMGQSAFGQALNAPVYDTQGFFIGASLLGAGWSLDDVDADAETGAGIGLRLGYNFNQNFGAFINLDGSSIDQDDGDSYGLGHFDLGVQWIFRSEEKRFRPLVRGSYLGMAVSDDNIEISGSGFGLGLGALYFLTERLALDFSYTHSWVNISQLKIGSVAIDIDDNATTGRFFLGLTYHF
jgi:opacity protein-like surface antigen